MPQCSTYPRMRLFTGTSAALPLLLCLVVLLAGGCAGRSGGGTSAQADNGAIRFVLPGGNPASEQDILRLADNADYILVGEQHDNPMDHKAQAELVDLLARKGASPPLLGLEMLPRRYYDFQLSSFSKGKIPLAELPEALNWKHTWGYDFALYQPIFEVARKHGLTLYGLNLPDVVRRSVSRGGLAGLSQTEKGELPRRIIPPQPAQKEKLLAVFRMHGAMRGKNPVTPSAAEAGEGQTGQKSLPAMMPATPGKGKAPKATAGAEAMPSAQAMLDRFLLIQSLWDSTMAEQAVDNRNFARRRLKYAGFPALPYLPMVILAGAGHVEYGYGIASRIKHLEPDARVLLVMPFSGAQPEPGAADVYYYSEQRSHSPYGFTLAERKGRLVIVNVAPDSRAEAAGVRAGDAIVRAGGAPVLSPMDLHKAAVQAKRQRIPLRFTLERRGELLERVIPEARTE